MVIEFMVINTMNPLNTLNKKYYFFNDISNFSYIFYEQFVSK